MAIKKIDTEHYTFFRDTVKKQYCCMLKGYSLIAYINARCEIKTWEHRGYKYNGHVAYRKNGKRRK